MKDQDQKPGVLATCVLAIAVVLISGSVSAQLVDIPDDNLRSMLLAVHPELMVGDQLDTGHPALGVISSLYLTGVEDYTGLEHFTGVGILSIHASGTNGYLFRWPQVFPPNVRSIHCEGMSLSSGAFHGPFYAPPPSLVGLSLNNCHFTISEPFIFPSSLKSLSLGYMTSATPYTLPENLEKFVYAEEAFPTSISTPPVEWPVGLDSLEFYGFSSLGTTSVQSWLDLAWPAELTYLFMAQSAMIIGPDLRLQPWPVQLEQVRLYFVNVVEIPMLPLALRQLRVTGSVRSGCFPYLPPGLEVLELPFDWNGTPSITCLMNLPIGVSVTGPMLPICTIWNSACLGSNEIAGNVFSDLDLDGELDAGELGLRNANVLVQPGGVITSTSNIGAYSAWVSAGEFNVEPIPQLYQTFTGVPRSISFADIGLSDTGNDLGLFIEPNIQDLRTSIVHTPPRPGFTNKVWLNARNVGTIATDGMLRLTFEPQQSFVGSTPDPTSVNGNVLEWPLSLEVGGLPPYISVTLQTPTSTLLGTEFTYIASADPINTDETPTDNSSTITVPVVGSFDPNDKRVSPGTLTPAEVAERKRLEYTVRFQNTGTFLAENVLITDFLSADLDPMTFEFVGSSHACQWYISDGQLHVQFEGIMLPDSNANEPASHGYVKFRIAAMEDLQLGASVSNSASIYFDFNIPIVTEPAVFAVSEITSVVEQEASELGLYPNPVENVLWLRPGGTSQGPWNIRIMDLSGRQVLEVGQVRRNAPIQVGTLPCGMYLVQVSSPDQAVTERFVKH